MSAITSPSSWVFKSKDTSIITTEEVEILVRGGFTNGVKEIRAEKEYVYLDLSYTTTRDRIKHRFGSAPVAVICLRENQTVQQVEKLEDLRDKFGITKLEPLNGPSKKKTPAVKKASTSKAAPKKRKLDVDEPSSDEQDSDINYFGGRS